VRENGRPGVKDQAFVGDPEPFFRHADVCKIAAIEVLDAPECS